MAIGYACITIGVQGTGLSRCSLKNAAEDSLRTITASNLAALEAMIDYNIRNKIMLFRISSDIIPFGSHSVNQIPWWEEYREQLQLIGKKIKDAGMRVSMHPGQYTVLNSPDPKIVQNAVEDLLYHEKFLSALGIDRTGKLILHIGGVYGDKEKAMGTFLENYGKLSEEVKQRLIIENDDKNYNISEVLKIAVAADIPVVYDNLHHLINPPSEYRSEEEWIMKCAATWSSVDGKQKIHYSQQKEGGSPGSHSDTIYLSRFLDFYQRLPDKEIDIMLEVKDKNLSAIKCIHAAVNRSSAKYLEQEWARYKYYVLSKSARLYQEIRELLKDKNADLAKEFYEIIETAAILAEDKGAEINAAQHVWGYISKDCTKAEKNRFDKLLKAYEADAGAIQPVKNHLLKCAEKRELEYLVNSLYFYIFVHN